MSPDLQPSDDHNLRLLANVHPPGWVNPKAADRYQLVVVGAGPAGLVAAAGAAGLGAKVALVERGLIGGDCLNVGCVPSKALLRAARAVAEIRRSETFGVRVPASVTVDFPAVMERLRRVRADLSAHDSAERFRSLGVDVFLGEGRFTGSETLEVAGQALHFRRAVIATGTRAHRPPVFGLAEAGYLTNETIFSLTELPARLAVIGAGPIGCELAQAFARFGSRVTLLGRPPRVLPRDDEAAARLLEQVLQRDGVELRLGDELQAVERRGSEKVLRLDGGEVSADAVLVAAGREPNVDSLNLEAAGVEYNTKHGVKVNDRLQTSNARIYAAGDVCSRFRFTHAADAMARIVVQNALFFGRANASALTIPWCTYTDPEVAHVGLSEHDAKEQGMAVRVFVQELKEVDRAVLDGETEGFVKVLVKEKTDTILGATVVASHAGEMIAELALAMTGGLGLKTIARTIHPYPTQAEAIKKVADAYSRTRLTPLVRWLLKKWMGWTR